MNYGSIKKTDIANGPGVRVSLFVSGCTHHCKGCFNPETWSFEYGTPYTAQTEEDIITALLPLYISGLTLLGGEPMEPQNQQVLVGLLKKVKTEFPSKTVWCYTGYDYVQDLLLNGPARCNVTDEMLGYIDVLVDGEFKLEQKNLKLRFRGSENQRLIDLRKSELCRKIVLWEE